MFKCDKCEVYFKSKKGYEGHVANRHAPRFVGADGKLKSKKEMEGLNKVIKLFLLCIIFSLFIFAGFKRNPGQEGS